MWAVRWTQADGRTAEWHYAREDDAANVATLLRRGWRKDARAERIKDLKGGDG